MVFQIVQTLVPYFHAKLYTSTGNTDTFVCQWNTERAPDISSIEFIAFVGTLHILELTIPFIQVLICCMVSQCLLRRAHHSDYSSRDHPSHSAFCCKLCPWGADDMLNKEGPMRRHNVKTRASRTIILITVLYIVMQLPNVVYIILAFLSRFYSLQRLMIIVEHQHCRNFALVLSVGLHAATIPIIYYTRMRKFRRFSIKLVKNIISHFSRRCSNGGGPTFPLTPRCEEISY